jgi:hypothetical protein
MIEAQVQSVGARKNVRYKSGKAKRRAKERSEAEAGEHATA